MIELLGTDTLLALRLAFAAMLAILFLQSSIDKIIHWKGEREYLTRHLAKSPLKSLVPLLLPVLTLVEIFTGAFSAIGIGVLLWNGSIVPGKYGMALGCVAIIMLFLGQRLAKDYGGAASLVPYFLLCAGGLAVWG
jgi:hypothetical protein